MRTTEQTHTGLPSTSYGENAEHIRDREFSRLSKQTYVDHAGGALYSEAQLRDVFQVGCTGAAHLTDKPHRISALLMLQNKYCNSVT